MLNQSGALDRTYAALASPARRSMIERLARGPASVSELAGPLEMSLPAALQHLRLLERSGLVASRKAGRVRTFRIETRRLDAATAWLARQRALWDQRFDRLDAVLRESEETDE